MGLNYPNNVVGCTAAGWYNGHYTITNHENNGYDTEKSAKASMERHDAESTAIPYTLQQETSY